MLAATGEEKGGGGDEDLAATCYCQDICGMLIAPERCHSHFKEALERGADTHPSIASLVFFFFVSVVVGDWVMEFREKIKDTDGFCNSGIEIISWLRSTCYPFNGTQHSISAVR